jgi:transposase
MPYEREQQYLLPPSMMKWLPGDHLVYFLLDTVELMKLSPFYAGLRNDGRGAASYDPRMMVPLLLYAYCEGIRSSRVIERLCRESIAYRVITANQQPDHSSICRFRKEHAKALEGLFIDVLRLCQEAGLVKVGKVGLDGTKIKANAALAANRTLPHIEESVKQMLREAEEADAAEDARHGKGSRGDELPEALRDRPSRLNRLRECRDRLKREAEETRAKQQEKIAAREAEERDSGRKKCGRKPSAPETTVNDQAKANVTDPDSRIMKTRSGYVQGYNAQAAVSEDQIIIAAELTQDANDQHQLHPMIEKAQENLATAQIEKPIAALVADAGYSNEDNLKNADPEGPELFIATNKDWKQREKIREQPAPRGRLPLNLSLRERMERKLLTQRGRAIYGKRSVICEPPFGYIKVNRGADRFMRRGFDACQSEWKLLCTTHNLLKLYASGRFGLN